MKMNINFSMDFVDVLNIIIDEYSKQNSSKIKPQLAYAVDKNKKLIYNTVYKNKKLVNSFKQFEEVREKIEKVKAENTKINKKGIPVYDEKKIEEETKKIEEENIKIIEQHKENMKMEIELDENLYKLKMEHLPDLPKNIIDFLIKYDLIIE